MNARRDSFTQARSLSDASLRSKKARALAPIAILMGLIFGFVMIVQNPVAQNAIWELTSLGVFGKDQEIFPVAGTPAMCGNARPMSTLSWMGSVDFNVSTVGHIDIERHLHDAHPNAPIFVVGCGHSGTTEVITMLDRHPLVYAYLDGPGMEFAVQANSFSSTWSWLPVTHLILKDKKNPEIYSFSLYLI